MGTEELAERLSAIAEELADMALDRLRQAADQAGDTGTPDPGLLAEERQLTRARRAVEKAAALLSPAPGH